MAAQPGDLVERRFTAPAPNRLWVAGLTYVATWSGFGDTAFIVDACGRRVGWRVSTSLRADLALDALEMAIWTRRGGALDGLIHHWDRRVQYRAIRHSERLADGAAVTSAGSKGDPYDNALAEPIHGLSKTELIRRRGPWRTVDQVELATLDWVDWYDTRRLHSACNDLPPAEYEAMFYSQPTTAPRGVKPNAGVSIRPRAIHLGKPKGSGGPLTSMAASTAADLTGADREMGFEAAVRAESGRLFGLAFTILRDRGEAEDAVQDTMAVAWRAWDQLIDPTRRGSWLTRICVRKAVAQRRGMLRRSLFAWEARPAAGTDPAAASNPDLDQAYRRLSGHQRAVLALHYNYGYTLDECADLMGCRPGSARSHLGRALDKLRREMADA